jgi:hypothetical protein
MESEGSGVVSSGTGLVGAAKALRSARAAGRFALRGEVGSIFSRALSSCSCWSTFMLIICCCVSVHTPNRANLLRNKIKTGFLLACSLQAR